MFGEQLTTIAALHRRISPWKMLLHWFITFWGNLAGSLFVMAVIIGYGGIFDKPVYHDRVVAFGTAKAITPEWHQIFLRGIGANWLVCLAAYLSFMGREYFSKVIGIWWPTFAFVMLSFDHVVANMFYVPIAIFVGTPGLSVGHYIGHSMIPSLLGNIVGGGLFVGVVYWYMVCCPCVFVVVWDECGVLTFSIAVSRWRRGSLLGRRRTFRGGQASACWTAIRGGGVWRRFWCSDASLDSREGE